MYFSTSIIASALLGFAAATTNDSTGAYPYPAPASSATALAASPMSSGMDAGATAMSAGTVATHVIQVGGSNGSTVYLPNSITANPGDLVQFQFNAVVGYSHSSRYIPLVNSGVESFRGAVDFRSAMRTDSEHNKK
jgi:plastocyanin